MVTMERVWQSYRVAMRKYFSFFKLRLLMGLQYRTAALAGVVTQFFWGFMEIMVFCAFYETDAQAFPMSFAATASYIWLQQAFLSFFMVWFMENEILDAIVNGNVAYELCRPVDIYWMWFSRSMANRTARALLRCFPVLVVAYLLPRPFGILVPEEPFVFFSFFVTLLLGFLVTVAFCMVIYMLTFFTVSAQGLRILCVSAVEFLSGAVVPIPFFPEKIARMMALLPFGSMQNVPLLVYGGSLEGEALLRAVLLQLFWLAFLVAAGRLLWRRARRRIIVQGG